MYSFSVLYGNLYDFYSDEFLFGQSCFELLYFRLRRIKIRAFDFMAIRMASATILQSLKARADLADKIIGELRRQISAIKTATAANAGEYEEDRLRKENEALKKEIEQVKIKLMVAEIRNGVRQVPVPQRKIVNSNEAADAGTKPVIAAPQVDTSVSQPQPKKTKKEVAGTNDKSKVEKGNKKESKVEVKLEAPTSGADGDTVDISRLDLRIGKIIAVEKHPDAEKLYVETVDVGEEKPRTIVSGLVEHIPIEKMHNRLAVFMCNLKPSKMRGISSEGMIMCANAGKVEILDPPPGVVPGDQITFEGYPGVPDKQLNPKKKIWETLKPDVRTNNERIATYKGVPFKVEGKGVVTAPTLPNAQIS